MYEAKRRGRGRCAVFDQSMHHHVTNRLTRENDLRRAIEQSLLRVHYQPIVDLKTGRLRGFEALARWPESWSFVETEEFMSIAEDTGLIGPMGLQVLRTALADLMAWRRGGLVADDVRMSVNVSGRQLDDPNFPRDVLDAIAAVELPAELISLEITETTFMREPERISAIVSEIGAPGVGLEMDDFGTGYSSLAALHKFPVNALKIDQSFVASLDTTGDGEVIVRSILGSPRASGSGDRRGNRGTRPAAQAARAGLRVRTGIHHLPAVRRQRDQGISRRLVDDRHGDIGRSRRPEPRWSRTCSGGSDMTPPPAMAPAPGRAEA